MLPRLRSFQPRCQCEERAVTAARVFCWIGFVYRVAIMTPALKDFIDRIVVPALVEKLQQDNALAVPAERCPPSPIALSSSLAFMSADGGHVEPTDDDQHRG